MVRRSRCYRHRGLAKVTYKYDAFGLKLETATDADGSGAGSPVTLRHAYDGSNVLADLDANSSLTTHYDYGDQPDQLLARNDGSAPRWYLPDRLGSARTIIDNGATPKDSINYDAWGNITSETDPTERGRYTWTSREACY